MRHHYRETFNKYNKQRKIKLLPLGYEINFEISISQFKLVNFRFMFVIFMYKRLNVHS